MKDYEHPFFTYHTEWTMFFEDLPYSLYINKNKFQYDDRPPFIITEALVNSFFFGKVVRLGALKIPEFLQYQYNSYMSRLNSLKDPVLFLEYVEIQWQEWVYWQDDTDKIHAMLDWLKAHPYYKHTFPEDQPEAERKNLYVEFPKIGKKQRGAIQENPKRRRDAPDTFRFKAVAREHLDFLSGFNSLGKIIMGDQNFQNMLEYVDYLIEQKSLPEVIHPIHHVQISQAHLRYAFYLIHKEVYGERSKIDDHYILLLHALFPGEFEGSDPSTTKRKFSTPPGSWEQDIKNGKRSKKVKD